MSLSNYSLNTAALKLQYEKFLREGEYKYSTIIVYSKYVMLFVNEVQPEISSDDNNLFSAINDHLSQMKIRLPRSNFHNCRVALRQFYELMTAHKYPVNNNTILWEARYAVLVDFRLYSENVKHMSKQTVDWEINQAGRFLDYVWQIAPIQDYSEINAGFIRNFIADELTDLGKR